MRVADLARAITVKASYIEALEAGQYDRLPTKVYVKGFVRSYARYFCVPEEILFHLFEREYSIFHNINHTDDEEEVSKMPRVPWLVVTPRTVAALVGIAALVGVVGYLLYGVDNFVSSPWLVVEEPMTGSTVTSDRVTVSGRTRPNAQVRINGQAVLADTNGAFREDVMLAAGTNTIVVESTNTFDKTTTQHIVVAAEYAIPAPPEEHRVVLVARAAQVDVAVRDGDTVLLDRTLAAGETADVTYTSDTVLISSTNATQTFVGAREDAVAPLDATARRVTDVVFPTPARSDTPEKDAAESVTEVRS